MEEQSQVPCSEPLGDGGDETGALRDSEPAARRWRLVPWAIGAIVLAVLGAGALLMRSAEAEVNDVALSDGPKLVSATPVRETTYRSTRRYIGTLHPWQEARIGPQLASGFVGSVLVRPGSVVKRGQVLATLDCRNASAASKATAMRARALEARLRAVTQESARIGEMLEGGYVSENEVEQRQAAQAETAARIDALMAEARGRQLAVNDCVLRAPFDGEVSERRVDPGAFVRPGTSLLTVVDRGIVRLTADAPEVDFQVVAPRTPVRIRLLATGQTLAGTISRRSPAANEATRTIHFEIDLADAGGHIPVGTTAKIEIDVGEPVNALEVPLTAATIRGARTTLFVVDGRNARKRVLDLLGERGGSAFVARTLPGDTLVVTEGRATLRDGDWVAAKTEALQ